MLSDIDEGKINLVIVKDLSRFGRNYVEAGMYVQRFTDSNIRFIAADDNYDSLVNSDDLLFPIKNVVNEMVLSISLDTFYSNKNYATRKI